MQSVLGRISLGEVAGRILLCAVMAYAASGRMALAAPDFSIKYARFRLQDDYYVLDAEINYRFTDTALEALRNGVPLTLVVRAELLRQRPFIWDEEVASVRLRFQLRYHALAQLYQVIRLDTGTQRNYASRQAAIQALGTLQDIPMFPAKIIDPQSKYRAGLSTDLDIEALPLPLRPIAYVTPSWYLGSDWYKWTPDF